MKSYVPKGRRRPIITSDNPNLKSWRRGVAIAALAAMRELNREASSLPVELTVTFFFSRPKSLPKRVFHKTTKPDSDKLTRALNDALTRVVFIDDSQVVGYPLLQALRVAGTDGGRGEGDCMKPAFRRPGELTSTVMKIRSEVTARLNAHPDPELARSVLYCHLDRVSGETVFFNDCEEVREILGMEK